jgi:hypothetical protein
MAPGAGSGFHLSFTVLECTEGPLDYETVCLDCYDGPTEIWTGGGGRACSIVLDHFFEHYKLHRSELGPGNSN